MISRILFAILFFSCTGVFCQEIFITNVDKDFLTGKVNYWEDPRFIKIEENYSFRQIYLNPTVYEAFIEMATAAKLDGIDLKVVSGTRSFEEQKRIWETKWASLQEVDPSLRIKTILEFSSMPATSRHHWGTDLDINSVEEAYFESEKGKAEYQWLTKNAGKFGFYQIYNTQTSGRTGYSEEKWHWSYMPLANFFLREYNEQIQYTDICGFKGAYLAEEISVLATYVNGISKSATPNAVAMLTAERRFLDQLKNRPQLKEE